VTNVENFNMKKLLLLILIIPTLCYSQKIARNEIDKFTKQHIIETEPVLIKSTGNKAMGAWFRCAGDSYYALFNGIGEAVGTIGPTSQIILLMENDSTVVLKSTGIQTVKNNGPRDFYQDHEYKIAAEDLYQLSVHSLKAVRRYTSEGYTDVEVPAKTKDRLRDLAFLFLKELGKK
jgi:hypothetical protein